MARTPKKPLLTKKKVAWVGKRNVAIKGHALNYNAAIQARYVRRLTALVRQMTATTKREVVRLIKSDQSQITQDASTASQARILTNRLTARFNQLFASKAPELAENMVDDADKASKSSTYSSLKQLSGGLSIKTDIFNGPMNEVWTASVAENVGLIKSISQEYLKNVQSAVMRSISNGSGLQDLVPYLNNQEGVTLRRARNIALDQTRKAYNNLNKGRMNAVGIKQYEWLHSGGSQKPRQEHIAMSGQIYSLDNPPVIDSKTGERGIPGQLPNCKCRMVPVVSFDGSEGE